MDKMGNRFFKSEETDCNDESNGLILNGYQLAEEIITELLGRLPPRDLLTCRLVCRRWNDTIFHILCSAYNKTFNKRYTCEELPIDFCYITLYNERIRGNLLQNVNGEMGFKHWIMLEQGGDGLIIENPPAGSDPLPEGVEEFGGHQSCFASSYSASRKSQRINVAKDKHLAFIINKYKPHIYVSEWVAARFDCGARYAMCVIIKCKGKKETKRIEHRVQQWEGSAWQKLECIIDEYPDDVEQIIFRHAAQDTQFWKGHYGMKMAGAVVKLMLDTIEL